jgi:hypothetical protein
VHTLKEMDGATPNEIKQASTDHFQWNDLRDKQKNELSK